jgi:hypothetical protein
VELADIPGTSLKVSPVAIGLGPLAGGCGAEPMKPNLFPPSVPRWVHWPGPLVTIEETAEAMHALFRQGKVRAIGVSNFSVSQTDRFRRVAPLHVLQPPYNLCRTYKRVSVFPSHLAGRGLARLERDESRRSRRMIGVGLRDERWTPPRCNSARNNCRLHRGVLAMVPDSIVKPDTE